MRQRRCLLLTTLAFAALPTASLACGGPGWPAPSGLEVGVLLLLGLLVAPAALVVGPVILAAKAFGPLGAALVVAFGVAALVARRRRRYHRYWAARPGPGWVQAPVPEKPPAVDSGGLETRARAPGSAAVVTLNLIGGLAFLAVFVFTTLL